MVKCDQCPPTCGNCKRRGAKCDYQELVPTEPLAPSVPAVALRSTGLDIAFEFDPRSAGGFFPPRTMSKFGPYLPASPATSIGFTSEVVYPNLCHRDVELLHHFATTTSSTFAPRNVMDRRLMGLIPEMAQSNDFVLHAVLGTSALHLAMVHADLNCGTYRGIALQHISRGMSAFRTTVNQLNPKNSDAIFTFSGISLIWEFALLHPAYETYLTRQHPIDRLLQVFALCRNVMKLWTTFPPSFYQSIPPKPRILQGITNAHKSKTMISKLHRIQDSELVPSELVSMATTLHELNCVVTADPVEQQAYSKAIDVLYVTFYKLVKHPGEWSLALRWAFTAPVEFMDLLQARQPLALVLLSHYCVLLHHGTNQWWMRDWSQRILISVSKLLDEQWIKHISWPLRAIEDGYQSPFCFAK